MKKILITAALAAAVIIPAMPVAADTTMSGPMICRAAKAGETPNAMMGSAGLMCRPINMARIHAAMAKMHAAMAKMMSSTPTPDQKAAAASMQDSLNSMVTQYSL